MQSNNASIIAFPVPIGALSPMDHRLCMQNPISLAGCLDPNVRELTGRADACSVHIGDYCTLNAANTCNALRELWMQRAMYELKHEVMSTGSVADIVQRYVKELPTA